MFRYSHIEVSLTTQSLHLLKKVIEIVKSHSVNIKWTLKQKFTLSMLVRRYLNTWKDKTILFNAYFIDAQLFADSSRLFSEKVIRTMWHDLSHKKDTDDTSKMIWQNIAFFKVSSAWAEISACHKEKKLMLSSQDSSFHNKKKIQLDWRLSTSEDDCYSTLTWTMSIIRERFFSVFSHHLFLFLHFLEFSQKRAFAFILHTLFTAIHYSLYYSHYYSLSVSIAFMIVSTRRQNRVNVDIASSSSSQKSKLSYRIHNLSWILKRAFRSFCDKSQDINSSTCIRADSFMNSINVSSSISSKSSMFKKHALRHINKVSSKSTSLWSRHQLVNMYSRW